MSAPGPVRLGIVGCGSVTGRSHLPALRDVAEIEVVALADLDAGACARVASQFGIARRYEDAAGLIADPEVEAVAVCVPVAAHAEVALLVMAAAKPVFVEKPLALSLADADRLVEAAAAAGVPAMIGLNFRWHPLVRQAREYVAAGALGRVRTITTTQGTNLPGPSGFDTWQVSRAQGGGGLVEGVVHHLDLWRALLDDEVDQVFAWTASERFDDDAGVIAGRMRGGAFAAATFTHTRPTHRVDIHGEEGVLAVDLMRPDGLELRLTRSAPRTRSVRLRARAAALRPQWVPSSPPGGMHRVSYRAEWRHFADCVRTGARPEPGLAEGRATFALVEAAIRATETGHPVTPLPPP